MSHSHFHPSGQPNSDNDSFSSSYRPPTQLGSYPPPHSLEHDEYQDEFQSSQQHQLGRGQQPAAASSRHRSQQATSALVSRRREQEDKDSYENQEDNSPSFFFDVSAYGRLALAAIGGYIEGLIQAPFVALKALDGTEAGHSTFTLILLGLLVIPLAIILHPFEVAGQWIEKASNELGEDESENYSSYSEEEPSLLSSILYYSFGFAGFVVGCLKAPFAGLKAVINTRQQETVIESLLRAPFRFLAALFSTPFATAKNWAQSSQEESDDEYEFFDSTPESRGVDSNHYKLDSLSDYLRVSFSALTGFIYGLIEAPFAAIDAALDTPENEPAFFSLIKAPYRFLMQLLKSPFSTADTWVDDKRDYLDREKRSHFSDAEPSRSILGHLRVAVKYLGGFITGCLAAPANAAMAVLQNDQKENLLSKLVLAPFRFLEKLITNPFSYASNWAETEKRSQNRKAQNRFEMHTESKISGFGGYLVAGLKGFVGLIVSVVAAPLVALADVFGLDPNSHPRESLFSSVVKAPVTFLEKMYDTTVNIVTWFATPSDDHDDCEEDHQHGRHEQRPLGQGQGERDTTHSNSNSGQGYDYPRPTPNSNSPYGVGSSTMHSATSYRPNSQQPDSVSRLPRPGYNMTEDV